MSIRSDRKRYLAALHGVQSGVLLRQQLQPESLKHLRTGLVAVRRDCLSLVNLLVHKGIVDEESTEALRTGLNEAHRGVSSLADLLILKGLISEDEYVEALANGMEAERRVYEAELTDRTGKRVHLR